jgi:hypothetical protein
MNIKDLIDEITFKAYDVYYRIEDLVFKVKDMFIRDGMEEPDFDEPVKPVKKKATTKKKNTKKKK